MVAWDKKGLTLEDTTLMYCTSRTPAIWPNTLSPVKSIRLFRAWHRDWHNSEECSKLCSLPEHKKCTCFMERTEAWRHLKNFAIANGAKFLVGTQVTCRDDDDDQDWAYTKELVQLLGREHIMGVAVGNEMDLLYKKMKDDSTVDQACIDRLWEGEKLWDVFASRVEELDSLGFADVPVTSVFSAAALGGDPFQEDPGKALVKSFLGRATQRYRRRYVFTFNHYSYFDPNLQLDPNSNNCSRALGVAACWGRSCIPPRSMAEARWKIERFTGRRDSLYWIGETGWSYPQPQTLDTQMAYCRSWSSNETFYRFYSGFLNWDLSIPGFRPPDHIFYFSVRTSLNFGWAEYFGLIDQCSNVTCKLFRKDYVAPVPLLETQGQWLSLLRRASFEAVACIVLVALACTWLYTRMLPEHWKNRSLRRVPVYYQDTASSSSSLESE